MCKIETDAERIISEYAKYTNEMGRFNQGLDCFNIYPLVEGFVHIAAVFWTACKHFWGYRFWGIF